MRYLSTRGLTEPVGFSDAVAIAIFFIDDFFVDVDGSSINSNYQCSIH